MFMDNVSKSKQTYYAVSVVLYKENASIFFVVSLSLVPRLSFSEGRREPGNIGGVNPLTTEFFPPRQHIFMHSAHTTFVGTPLPQHSLLSGQTWWGPHTWRDLSGNTVNYIHDPPQASNRRSKVDVSRIFAQHFPKLGPDLTDGTPYTTNLQVFLRPWVGSMNIIRIKNSRVNESH